MFSIDEEIKKDESIDEEGREKQFKKTITFFIDTKIVYAMKFKSNNQNKLISETTLRDQKYFEIKKNLMSFAKIASESR